MSSGVRPKLLRIRQACYIGVSSFWLSLCRCIPRLVRLAVKVVVVVARCVSLDISIHGLPFCFERRLVYYCPKDALLQL